MIALVAAYTAGLVLLLGGGSDGGTATAGPEPVAKSSLDKDVTRALEGVKSTAPADATDVPRFRKPTIRRVRCEGTSCDVIYSVGLPGAGRILVDQRPMLERLFSETDIMKVKLTAIRDMAIAGVPANKAGEEVTTGTAMLGTTCDRSKNPEADWESARGAEILQSICEVERYDQGRAERQEPVAKDDPAIKNPTLPEPGER